MIVGRSLCRCCCVERDGGRIEIAIRLMFSSTTRFSAYEKRREEKRRSRDNLPSSRGIFLKEVMVIIVVGIGSRDCMGSCFAVTSLFFEGKNETNGNRLVPDVGSGISCT